VLINSLALLALYGTIVVLGVMLYLNHKKLDTMNKTQAELVLDVQNLTEQLTASTKDAKDTKERIIKVGKETDDLLALVKRLQEIIQTNSEAAPELVAAIQAAVAQGAALKTAVDEVGTSAQAADEKVPDAPAQES
jgi:uncharacterized protein YoxC